MSEPADIPERVTRLERRVADVHDHARKTGSEVSSWRRVLKNHTEVLNGMGERLELFERKVDERFIKVDERFDELEAKVDNGFNEVRKEMRTGFAQANQNFATIDERFGMVKEGMEQITGLLTTALERPDET